MHQEQIKALLEEAAQSTWKRRNEILGELYGTVFLGSRTDDRGEGVRLVLRDLYMSTLEERPTYLPQLLPAFAVMCGAQEGAILGKIDWTQID